jgi:hypothetical protein
VPRDGGDAVLCGALRPHYTTIRVVLGLRAGFAPRAPHCITIRVVLGLRAGFAPRAPHWGRSTPPDPLQIMLAARLPHQCMPLVCPKLIPWPDWLSIPEACALDHSDATASNWGSQGQRPGPGVQGARPPLAAARAGQLHFTGKQLHSGPAERHGAAWLRAGTATRAAWGEDIHI